MAVEKIYPISQEIKKLKDDIPYIDQILKEGSEKASKLSSKKIKNLKEMFGF